MGAAGDVGKRLVDGNSLDERREIIEHIDGGIAQPLVILEMAADKNELRTEFARLPSRHATADSEGLGFVRSRKHNPAADGDGLAAQGLATRGNPSLLPTEQTRLRCQPAHPANNTDNMSQMRRHNLRRCTNLGSCHHNIAMDGGFNPAVLDPCFPGSGSSRYLPKPGIPAQRPAGVFACGEGESLDPEWLPTSLTSSAVMRPEHSA
jgi:hypothetical protein